MLDRTPRGGADPRREHQVGPIETLRRPWRSERAPPGALTGRGGSPPTNPCGGASMRSIHHRTRNLVSGKLLANPQGSRANGTKMIQWDDTGGSIRRGRSTGRWDPPASRPDRGSSGTASRNSEPAARRRRRATGPRGSGRVPRAGSGTRRGSPAWPRGSRPSTPAPPGVEVQLERCCRCGRYAPAVPSCPPSAFVRR